MGCCDKNRSVNQTYIPIRDRLIKFAQDNTDREIQLKFPTTKIYLFTFLDMNKMCIECKDKIAEMYSWVFKYNLLEDPVNNMKWILEDDMTRNLIVDDIGLKKSPSHIISDGRGNILDIVTGFPSADWLEQHLLPLIRG